MFSGMFQALSPLPADPILGLMAEYKADVNSHKVDLGAGVYKDTSGNTPIMDAVAEAQLLLINQEVSKVYVSPVGCQGFNDVITSLILGHDHTALKGGRVRTLQTPGGCGGLRVAAELIKRASPDATVWVSRPTWPNHVPLLGDAGVELKEYPYYDQATTQIDFQAMVETLEQASAGDLVLLHGCCHNPAGADLSQAQWQALTSLFQERNLIPFIDVAYLGLGDGLEQDAQGLRFMTQALDETIIVNSCSKNFGLYRERVGALIIIGRNGAQADASLSQAANIARGIYSMPPNYGASLVDIILNDSTLKQNWSDELTAMRERMVNLRRGLVRELAALGHDQFGYIAEQKGMFSFLGISPEQVHKLKREHSIYLVDSSRFNVAGLNEDKMADIAKAISSVLV